MTSLNHSAMIEVEERERLRKVKVPTELQERTNSFLECYLREVDTISQITDKMYAMCKAMEKKWVNCKK